MMSVKKNLPIPAVGLEAAKKAARAKAHPAPVKEIKKAALTQIEEKTMTNTKANFEKLTTDTATLNKEQMDAFTKSSTLFMKGSEDILKTYMALAQESVEKSSAAVKTLLGCKTLNELTEVQNKLAQESFDGFVTGATKLSEMSVKIATESFEPLNAQLSKTIKKATEAAAA
ncbi:MAG: phasin family protein [Micavibrio sp.]